MGTCKLASVWANPGGQKARCLRRARRAGHDTFPAPFLSALAVLGLRKQNNAETGRTIDDANCAHAGASLMAFSAHPSCRIASGVCGGEWAATPRHAAVQSILPRLSH